MLLFILLYGSPSLNQVRIWTGQVLTKFLYLTLSKIKAWVNARVATFFSRDDAVEEVVCNMAYVNDQIGNKTTVNCVCLTNDCCDADDTDCQNGIDSGDNEKYVDPITKRDILSRISDETGDLKRATEYWQKREDANEVRSLLEKRVAPRRTFTIVVSTIPTISLQSLPVSLGLIL
jgi:hypothetical protein